MSKIPESVRRLMAEVGPRWADDVPKHVRQMIDAFSPVLENCTCNGVEIVRDVRYGEHPRQILDIYRPTDGAKRPIVLFLHGGAFTDGVKDRSPQIYANVCIYLARHGVVALNVEYRLAPEFAFPSGTIDVAGAATWVSRHCRDIGGDPARLFVFGHSAGAAHAAHYAYAPSARDYGPAPAGLIVISGRVRADNLAANPNARKVEAYYGTDASVYEARSPVSMVRPDSVPTFIAIAEYENPLLDVYCLELAYRLAKEKGHAPAIMRLAGHNHTSIIAHWNTEEDALGRAVLDFIGETRRSD